MRGVTPLLERWLGNLLSRQFEGRHSKGNSFYLLKTTCLGMRRNLRKEEKNLQEWFEIPLNSV